MYKIFKATLITFILLLSFMLTGCDIFGPIDDSTRAEKYNDYSSQNDNDYSSQNDNNDSSEDDNEESSQKGCDILGPIGDSTGNNNDDSTGNNNDDSTGNNNDDSTGNNNDDSTGNNNDDSTGNNNNDGYRPSLAITVTRIDARPKGHPLDTGFEPDPIIDVAFMQSEGAAGSNSDKIQVTGPSVIRVPDWIPDSEKTHKNAKYYMYFAAHGSSSISLAWTDSITGKWHLFNRGDGPDKAWGKNGNYSGSKTPGEGVLDLNLGEEKVIWIDNNFGVDDHIASPDVVVDDKNKRIILYFHGPMHKIIGLKGTGNFVATSKWGLNFNLKAEGGENNQGPRNVLMGAQYMKLFEVEGKDNGQKIMRSFAFVNGSELWGAPIRTNSGNIASHANADDKGGYFTPSWSGDPTPIEHPHQPGEKPYWWQKYKSWTKDNPFTGVIKAPQLVPPENDIIIRKKDQDPRHFAILHDPDKDRDKVYVFYTCRRDLPESLVVIVFDLAGLSETERLDPALWKRVNDVEQVLLQPEMVWEGVEDHEYKHSASGAGHGYQFRDPDIFQDKDGKLYMFYCGKGEGAIGVAEVKINPQPTQKSLNMTCPFHGYTYLIGKKRNIGWETFGNIPSVDIEYTADGKNWTKIANGVKNKHHYTWTIPNTPSEEAKIRVKESGGSVVSVSDPFIIAKTKSAYVVRPSKGATVRAGKKYGLNWFIVGNIGKVDLEYSTNGGGKWNSIAKSVSSRPYSWNVPNTKANNVLIRIKETGGSVQSISAPFNIK
jgi:hypothetical protein